MTSETGAAGAQGSSLWARFGPLLCVLGLVGSMAGFYYGCFETRTRERERPLRGEAARNPYYAAQRLFAQAGIPVRSFTSPSQLPWPPPREGTLFLPTQRQAVTEQRSEELLDWVRGGGHLVVVTYTVWDEDEGIRDPILDPLGLQQHVRPRTVDFDDYMPDPIEAEGVPTPEGSAAPEDGEASLDAATGPAAEASPETAAEEPEAAFSAEAIEDALRAATEAATGASLEGFSEEVAKASFPGRIEPLEVQFDPRFYWIDSEGRAEWVIEDSSGIHPARVPLGEGRITALTDDVFMTRTHIGRYDHAELVYRLGMPGPVWFVTGDAWPGAFEVVWTHAWRILIAGAVLLVAWLVYASRRLGPLLPDPSSQRRRLMEHVEASGQFLWCHGARDELLEAERAALFERIRERHPGWIGLSPEELHARLEKGSGVSRDRIAHALSTPHVSSPEGFVSSVRLLQELATTL